MGTYGVALPVFADEDLLAAGDVGDSLWVSQSADGGSGYRTNIAVVFPDPTGGEAKVTIYDADGNAIASQGYSLDAAGFQQIGVGTIAGAVPIGRAEIQVIRGPAPATRSSTTTSPATALSSRSRSFPRAGRTF